MTLRVSRIKKREVSGTLLVNVEMAAAGLLAPFWVTSEMKARGYWRALGLVHGEKIDAKVAVMLPGTRPGYRYAIGDFPPVPLLEEPPHEHIGRRDVLDIDGQRFWKIGEPWQMSQADHLRAIGEVDGSEWKRYLAWRDTGFERRYRFESDRHGDRPGYVYHGCY